MRICTKTALIYLFAIALTALIANANGFRIENFDIAEIEERVSLPDKKLFHEFSIQNFIDIDSYQKKYSELFSSKFKALTTSIVGKIIDSNGNTVGNAEIVIKEIRDTDGDKFPSEVIVKKREWSAFSDSKGTFRIDNIPLVSPIRLSRSFLFGRPFPDNLMISVFVNGSCKYSSTLSSINAVNTYYAVKFLPSLCNVLHKCINKEFDYSKNIIIPNEYKKQDITLNIVVN